ncbi:hypothetical protein [Aliamphritea spongicola]|nr:hypothetical protein [Aliamphritea spongicola]
MLILLTLLVICVALLIGIPVPFAFGLALIYMSLTGDHDPAGFLTSGHWRMNVLVLLAIPLFIIAGTIMERARLLSLWLSWQSYLLAALKAVLHIQLWEQVRYSDRLPAVLLQP